MPANYNGATGANVPTDPTTVSLPVDGDARNAESANIAFRKIADFIQMLKDKAAFLNAAITATSYSFTAPQQRAVHVDPHEFFYQGTTNVVAPNDHFIVGGGATQNFGFAAHVPAGATVVSVELLCFNDTGAAKDITALFATLKGYQAATPGYADSGMETTVGGANKITVPTHATNVLWYAIPLRAGPFVAPDDGKLAVCGVMPAAAIRVYGARIRYDMTEFKPAV